MASDGDRLDAILDLIDRIDRSLAGLDAEAFAANELLVDATAYRLMHIAENSLRLSADLKSRYPDQPWQLMAGFRTFTAHDYFGTVVHVLWTTARDHLEPLRRICLAELAGENKIEGE